MRVSGLREAWRSSLAVCIIGQSCGIISLGSPVRSSPKSVIWHHPNSTQMALTNPYTSAFEEVATSNHKDKDTLKSRYEALFNLLNSSFPEFQHLHNNGASKLLNNLFSQKIPSPDPHFASFLNKLIKLIYSSKSPLKACVFQVIPDLIIQLQKYLSNEESDEAAPLRGIDEAILTIYNHECHLSRTYHEDNHLNVDTYLLQLLRNNEAVSFSNSTYQTLPSLNFSNKSIIKTFLLFLYYLTLKDRSEKSVVSFFHLIYVYCGGKPSFGDFGLYLLNKSHEKTIFVHRVSEEEMEWILLVLYYIHGNYKHMKFEVIAATGMLRRKCANESKFRICEMAQSMLHLFENEYEDVF